jgi:hypothetical protein
VLLGWRLSSDGLLELSGVHVQRAASLEGPYSQITAAPIPPSTWMSFEDRSAPAGSTCWYRLELLERRGVRHSTPALRVRVVAPPGVRTALDAPVEFSSGRVEIQFHIGGLPTPVRLSIYDAAGRRVRRFDLGMHEPGDYVHAWDREDDSGRRTPRGLFLVRLEAGRQDVAKKLALVHE